MPPFARPMFTPPPQAQSSSLDDLTQLLLNPPQLDVPQPLFQGQQQGKLLAALLAINPQVGGAVLGMQQQRQQQIAETQRQNLVVKTQAQQHVAGVELRRQEIRQRQNEFAQEMRAQDAQLKSLDR